MATRSKRSRRRSTAASASRNAAVSEQAVITVPIVLTRNTRKRRRKRYTKGTRGQQRFILGLSEAAYRLTNSLSKGFDTFNDRSKRSRWRKRDGLERDFFRNASRGVNDAFNELGRAPGELARRVSTRRVAKTFRFLNPFLNPFAQ
jgi:hypothetical protein